VGTLLHAADVAIEPSHDFLDDLAALRHEDLVPAGIEHVLLVRACQVAGSGRPVSSPKRVIAAVQSSV
jgi:hypothetical protein